MCFCILRGACYNIIRRANENFGSLESQFSKSFLFFFRPKHTNTQEEMASNPKKAKKRADVNGWCSKTLEKRLKNMKKLSHTGDWRRDDQVENVHYKIASTKWTHQPTMKTFSFSGPIQVGMENLLAKLESAQNRAFQAIPLAVREEFSMVETTYRRDDYEVSVSFSEAKYGSFRLLYCRLCTSKKNLKEKFWDKFPEKLPADEIGRKQLMSNWDSLNLSWNYQDVLGCLLPNDPKHYALVNARRFIQRPILHWSTVHEEKKKGQKSQIKLTNHPSLPPPNTEDSDDATQPSSQPSSQSSSSPSSSQSSSGSSSQPSSQPKVNYRHSQLRQPTIGDLSDPRIDFKGHSPKNANEEMALGHALKMLHVGANKMLSNKAVLENYYSSVEIKIEQYEFYKSLNQENIRKGTCLLPRPVTARLNDHNINDGYEAILKAYRNYNQDTDNPYRVLENTTHWGFIHDATSHWVKELNTVILRAVSPNGSITKVPFSFNQVPGSLTGEVLAEEIMTNISSVKTVKNNAASSISKALVDSSQSENRDLEKLQQLQLSLKEAVDALDFESMNTLTSSIQALQAEMANNNQSTITENTIIPTPPHYFKISILKGVDHGEKIIHLEISPENVPTSICGDSCATNLKANRLVKSWYGVSSLGAGCSSHAASGTIRRTCTSATMSDPDATALYNALRAILKHFAKSPKSTELLNSALDALEKNDIHMLVWGGTRMAGFLDGCKQSSNILVPFLDTLIAGKIRDEERNTVLSAKGLYTLELFADLHPIFADQYLHVVDSDRVLSCEVFSVAHKTALILIDPTLSTPKADTIFSNLFTDEVNNVCVTLLQIGADGEMNSHTQILNEKLTRHKTFENVKEEVLTTKTNILKRLHDNIIDQVAEDSIFNLLNLFDLSSSESFDDRVSKLKTLHDLFGKDVDHTVTEKWFDFDIQIKYKARLHCTQDQLVEQFTKGFPKMNSLARELREDRQSERVHRLNLTQHQLWTKFLNEMGMQCPDLCELILIMLSVPPNSGWVERAYSYLERICQKQRNRMSIEKPLKELFFLALLNLKTKDSYGYRKEIEILSGTA